jgi:phosphoribosylformylglycinamidine synthase subunit PurQ / glutaminase
MEDAAVKNPPNAAVLCAPGTNRDADVSFALQQAGARPTTYVMSDIVSRPSCIDDAEIVVIAGGFSYADALGAGRLFAVELEASIGERITAAIAQRRPVIGICNGFQTLVRMGILPGAQEVGALGHNDAGVFDCRWIQMAPTSEKCIWTRHLTENISCPIAHGEGRFTTTDTTLAKLIENDQVALRYVNGNPNGSVYDIAGICDDSGVVIGLMPHPENHVVARQHPQFHRGVSGGLGLSLFVEGVKYVRN